MVYTPVEHTSSITMTIIICSLPCLTIWPQYLMVTRPSLPALMQLRTYLCHQLMHPSLSTIALLLLVKSMMMFITPWYYPFPSHWHQTLTAPRLTTMKTTSTLMQLLHFANLQLSLVPSTMASFLMKEKMPETVLIALITINSHGTLYFVVLTINPNCLLNPFLHNQQDMTIHWILSPQYLIPCNSSNNSSKSMVITTQNPT